MVARGDDWTLIGKQFSAVDALAAFLQISEVWGGWASTDPHIVALLEVLRSEELAWRVRVRTQGGMRTRGWLYWAPDSKRRRLWEILYVLAREEVRAHG